MITPYVTMNSRPEFMRNKTGFGYMVYDIAKSVGKTEQVDVLCSDSRGDGFEIEGVNYLERSFLIIFYNLLGCLNPFILFKLWIKYRMSNGSLIRMIYYWLMTGYLCKLLRDGRYDIVHIHGCSFSTEFWMQSCQKCRQKYVVTLHGLNSFSDTVRLEPAGKKYERDFLQRVVNGEFVITVISTGMKRVVENTYRVNNYKTISVVCNSFRFNRECNDGSRIDIRKLYKLDSDAVLILYVGNICKRKNQGQIIRAFDLLPSSLADKTFVLFLGGNNDKDYNFGKISDSSNYRSHFIACGPIEKEIVPQYYAQGNYVALMSLSEGFGLSLIEGMHFGLPCIGFSDMDAFEDIYDSCAMIGIKTHSDQAVAEGLQILLSKDWNKCRIKEYSKKFESENMAKKYIEVYNSLT